MKKHLSNFALLLLSCMCIALIESCKDNSIDPDFNISSINPDSAKIGDVIRINGNGFSQTPGEDTVKFNGINAVVQTAATNTLLVQVPSGATSGTITVKVGNKSASSSEPFKVLNQGPNSGVSYITVLGGQASFTKLATLPQTPTVMYIDKAHNLIYYSDFSQMNNGSSVYKVSLTGGSEQKLTTDARITNVKNITSDGNGNVYVLAVESSDQIEGSIYKITADGSQVTQIAAKVKTPNNPILAANATGDVYYGENLYNANGQTFYNAELQSSMYASLYKNAAFYYILNAANQPIYRYDMTANTKTDININLQGLFTPDDPNYKGFTDNDINRKNFGFSVDDNANLYALYMHKASDSETRNTFYLRQVKDGNSTLLAKFTTIFSVGNFANDPQASTGGILFASDASGNLYLRYNDRDIIKITHN
ncbi:IPT/TIG domain-containing protein [Mucilaginibacter sp. Bleaf8]|uniref:IPT/TIG domain-containing protein n=1 Tax=Mucilaginibacter sp. Bleaf8 TaxID=2834430 RepID=UPI001BCF47B8|nr:IPT/TIG domain-containing protein [Mucilaginibacter sp. Bleaf8]MBS7564243.1 IPT/TIG domain-containing protein [Mucilaginibacter sp. Bleaf8]